MWATDFVPYSLISVWYASERKKRGRKTNSMIWLLENCVGWLMAKILHIKYSGLGVKIFVDRYSNKKDPFFLSYSFYWLRKRKHIKIKSVLLVEMRAEGFVWGRSDYRMYRSYVPKVFCQGLREKKLDIFFLTILSITAEMIGNRRIFVRDNPLHSNWLFCVGIVEKNHFFSLFEQ